LHYDVTVVRIEVKKELGTEVVTREHGRRLRDLILKGCVDPPVIVDFGGLRINSVSFFDEAFGQIALNHSAQELKKVESRGLEKFDSALLQDIIASRLSEARKRSPLKS
jgi:hypothetical protein